MSIRSIPSAYVFDAPMTTSIAAVARYSLSIAALT